MNLSCSSQLYYEQKIEQSSDNTWHEVSFNLPEAASNKPNFKLRFSLNANNASERAHLDDLSVIGYAL